jgi:hypothetical protein
LAATPERERANADELRVGIPYQFPSLGGRGLNQLIFHPHLTSPLEGEGFKSTALASPIEGEELISTALGERVRVRKKPAESN